MSPQTQVGIRDSARVTIIDRNNRIVNSVGGNKDAGNRQTYGKDIRPSEPTSQPDRKP